MILKHRLVSGRILNFGPFRIEIRLSRDLLQAAREKLRLLLRLLIELLLLQLRANQILVIKIATTISTVVE